MGQYQKDDRKLGRNDAFTCKYNRVKTNQGPNRNWKRESGSGAEMKEFTEKERWAGISELKVGACVAVNKGVDFGVEEDGEERKRERK